MTTRGETAKSPRVDDPLQLRGPEDENLHDPLAPADPLLKRQSVVEETPAGNVPTSAQTLQEFTPSESEKSKAEIGTRKKVVKTPLQGVKTQSLTGANGTIDASQTDHTEKQVADLQRGAKPLNCQK